jgi:DNA polymerase-4
MQEKDKNKLLPRTKARVLFIDMNSFFASCEQQDNFYLRGRPVAVCVYTGIYGCIIAPSIEAKKYGVKTGMRLNDAVKLCKDLIPIETHPDRYRGYHIKIMNVLRAYCDNVYPKSIDEAVVDLTNYELIYKDVEQVAKSIKKDIKEKVGDWLKCSIGIAPNAFLAKLASDIQKPDGLTLINPENIDVILSKLELTDLAGIAHNTAEKLKQGGVNTPLKMRHTSAENLKAIFKSVLGYHWYCRLNFIEIDLDNIQDYKSMQAMRHLNKEQRASAENMNELLIVLCLTLERRMVKRQIFANTLSVYFRYSNGDCWDDYLNLTSPIQDGADIYSAIQQQMLDFEKSTQSILFHKGIISISLSVSKFVKSSMVQANLFEDNTKKNHLRKVVYDLKEKYGKNKLMRAIELREEEIYQDVIGFGSVKDLYNDDKTEMLS